MAEKTPGQELEKREDTGPEPDPITDRSLSSHLLISSILLVVTLMWALFDEVIGQRPWKEYQESFVDSYLARLERLKRDPNLKEREAEVKESEEYQMTEEKWKDAQAASAPRVKEIDARDAVITLQLGDITPPFQDLRAKTAALRYKLETSTSESLRKSLREDIEDVKKEVRTVAIHSDGELVEQKRFSFSELESLYNGLREEKARLVAERLKVTKEASDLKKELDDYLQNNFIALRDQQIQGLIDKNRAFEFQIKQVNLGVAGAGVVDRCESCHLGVREPVTLTARNMGGERAFVSHPDPDLFRIHDPDRFGCSACHGGNGRATTSEEKAHGRYKHWLWPLYYGENVQAGCNQCHDRDRVTAGADVLNKGKDLFQNRGCMGCHRYEGFDRETDGLSNARQTIKQLEMERDGYNREIKKVLEDADAAQTDEEARRLLRRADALRQNISRVEARIDQIHIQSRYLLQDQKKVGPNLKEIKLKLNRDWIPMWLRDPQAFRPGTKMPSFRLDPEEIEAVTAFLWQSALDGPPLATQTPGDPANGKELFRSRGCLACHSIDGRAIGLGSGRVGGDFAADLSRVGEKANYDYIVRWVHNPRQRTAPYCPTEKRDLTAEDYAKKGLPFIFDSDHSKCPNDGHELQIQNMTVMPNFRLADQDARDIATFLMAQKKADVTYSSASFVDDTSLREKGERLVKSFGCASCHEIRGLEEEQRIGTELTKEGSKPIERLDFAVLTHDAMQGIEPFRGNENGRSWYDHKGFFEHKLQDPAIYDRGKEKTPEDRLRMPNIFLEKDGITALTTFLLGSVEASVPETMRYSPVGQKKEVQDGWWVIKKYNCMGCHNVLAGQDSVLMGLPMYQDADGKEQLPPRLTTEGARVNPDWLLRFLKDPSLGAQGERGAQAASAENGGASLGGQSGANRNGIRPYLRARMPTFNFSPNELQALVNFFMGASSQPLPHIAERLDPLTGEEQGLARALFTSQGAPCLKCHITGDPSHDASATAPNFLVARERLKPAWTRRWLLDPAIISPGTSMPSGLFREDREQGRWVFAGPTPAAFGSYDKDHADLLVRYMFQITADEQRRLAGSASAGSAAPSAAPAGSASRRQAVTGIASGRSP